MRLWGILSLIVVMGYSILGWHHHVGVHVCLTYEHLFLDGQCLYDACMAHQASSRHVPLSSETHHQGNGHSCKCSVEYLSAVDGVRTAKINQLIRQLSPLWMLLALTALLFVVSRKSGLPDSFVVRLLQPPLLSGQGLRAPPFLFF